MCCVRFRAGVRACWWLAIVALALVAVAAWSCLLYATAAAYLPLPWPTWPA